MELTPAVASALTTKYSQIFQQTVLDTEIFWPKFAQQFNSTTETEQHVWLDRIPKLRQWQGDRIIQNASLRSFSINNLAYELTEELDAYKVRDNKIDAFAPLVQLMAMEAKKWPDNLFFDATSGAIVQGATFITYDGVPFWSAAHPINVDIPAQYGSQSNFVNSAFSAANFFVGRQTMHGYRGADGLPLYVTPTLLMVPPATEAAGRQVLNTTYIAPAVALGQNSAGVMQENPLKGMADLLIVPDMTPITTVGSYSGTPWILMDSSKSLKPFLFQLRQAPEFVFNVAPNSPAMFSRHALQYGVSVRGAGSFGVYFYAYLGIA